MDGICGLRFYYRNRDNITTLCVFARVNWAMKVGDKVKFTGTRPLWFTNIVDNGNKLRKGAIYKVSYYKPASSWTAIKLAETGDLEYSASWFEVIK